MCGKPITTSPTILTRWRFTLIRWFWGGLYVLLLLLSAPATLGQAETISPAAIANGSLIFDHLTIADGLSEGTTVDILQDEQGFIWFGTQYGLNKYDGYQFTVYTHSPDNPESMSENNIRAVYLDSDGGLWVGTLNSGLDRMDRTTDTFTHYRFNPNNPDSLSNNTVRAIQEDEDGYLWIGTHHGLNRMDRETGVFTRYIHQSGNTRSLSSSQIYALELDTQGRLWVGTGVSTCLFVPESDDFTCYPLNGEMAGDIVYSLYADSAGIVWAGTNSGLNALDVETGEITMYRHDPADPYSISGDAIRVVYEDNDGRLWVGTQGEGLNLFDRVQKRFTNYRHDPNDPSSVSGNTILSLFHDRSGVLWLGTWAADLNYIAPSQHKFSTIYDVRKPLAVYAVENLVWVGSLENGFFQIDRETQAIQQFMHHPDDPNSPLSDSVFAIHPDHAGRLWLATINGLDRYNPATGLFERPFPDLVAATGLNNAPIRTLMEDRQGRLWLGTQNGLFCLDPETGLLDCYPYEEQREMIIHKIVEDDSGMLWVATEAGLYGLNPTENRLELYTSGPLAASITLQSILLDDDGTLWLGSWGSGLFHFEPDTRKVTHYTQQDGLPGDLILGIEKDLYGRLWLSTSNGLAVFNPDSGAIRTYDKLDGLPENDFNAGAVFQNDAGEIYFGSAEHVIVFSPDDIIDNSYVPPIVLTGFQLFNRQVTIDGDGPLPQHPNFTTELTLSYDQSVFSFEYAALNFSAPDRNQYSYKMEGFDADWNEVAGRRIATYTNLNPGVYTFRVRASNNDGVWNEDGLSIRLIITPPWWQAWWAYLLYFALGIAAVLGYVRYRTQSHARELAMQRLELAQERYLRETIERVDRSKDDERARIAREMHDGMAQTLAGLRFQVRTWQRLVTDEPDRLRTEIGDMNTVLDETLQELRRVIFAVRPVILSEMGLRISIGRLVESMGLRSAFEVQSQIMGDDSNLPDELAHAAFRIIQEGLHNVMRHAQARNVRLNVGMNPAMIEIEIRDDGVGFDTNVLNQRARQGHQGIVNLRERAAAFNGSAVIRSTPGQGTTLHVRLFAEKPASSLSEARDD